MGRRSTWPVFSSRSTSAVIAPELKLNRPPDCVGVSPPCECCRCSRAAISERPSPAGFWRDLMSVAGRALRTIPREPEALLPALIVPLFFFAVNVGALSDISSFAGVEDFESFRCPSP